MSHQYAPGIARDRLKLGAGLLNLLILFTLLLSACVRPSASTPVIPSDLSVEEHELSSSPQAEYTQLDFVEGTQAEIQARHENERSLLPDPHAGSCTVQDHFGLCASLGQDQLVAWDSYGSGLFASGTVTLTRNGSSVYQVPVGNSSPIGALRGLWVYDDHWALETAYVKNHQHGNEIDSQANGQITVDGQLLNKQFGYQETFGFQTMAGKPFYFFKKDGSIGVSYAGVDIPLGYSEVLHYGCCSAATLNPNVARNMVSFFARRGSKWYYIEIGVFAPSV